MESSTIPLSSFGRIAAADSNDPTEQRNFLRRIDFAESLISLGENCLVFPLRNLVRAL